MKKKKKKPGRKKEKNSSLARSIFHSRSGGQSHDGMTPTQKGKKKKKEVRDPPAIHSTWPHTLRHLITSTVERGAHPENGWMYTDIHTFPGEQHFFFVFSFLKIKPISWGEGGGASPSKGKLLNV
jgi:hypothetical protein